MRPYEAEGVPAPDCCSFDVDGALFNTGIICEAAEAGSACFWDSLDRAWDRVLEQKHKPVPLTKLQGGYMLGDCTRCHKGDICSYHRA